MLESNLPPALTPAAVTLALFGNEAGQNIYPSVDRVAHLLGLTRRTVERQISALRGMGILVPEGPLQGGRLPGGRGRSVLYWLNVDALPAREDFMPRHQSRGSSIQNPDADNGVHGQQSAHAQALPSCTPTPTTQTPTLVDWIPDIYGVNTPTWVSDDLGSDLLEGSSEGSSEEPTREERAVLSP